jgi:hypothetical protein
MVPSNFVTKQRKIIIINSRIFRHIHAWKRAGFNVSQGDTMELSGNGGGTGTAKVIGVYRELYPQPRVLDASGHISRFHKTSAPIFSKLHVRFVNTGERSTRSLNALLTYLRNFCLCFRGRHSTSSPPMTR